MIFCGNIYKKSNQMNKNEENFIPLSWLPIAFSFILTPVFFLTGGGDNLDMYDNNNFSHYITTFSLIFIPLGLLLSFFCAFFVFFEKNRKVESILLWCVCILIFPIFFIFSSVVFTPPQIKTYNGLINPGE